MFWPRFQSDTLTWRIRWGERPAVNPPWKAMLKHDRLLMEEILHQMIRSLSQCLQGFVHPRWCRISSINSTFWNTVCFVQGPSSMITSNHCLDSLSLVREMAPLGGIWKELLLSFKNTIRIHSKNTWEFPIDGVNGLHQDRSCVQISATHQKQISSFQSPWWISFLWVSIPSSKKKMWTKKMVKRLLDSFSCCFSTSGRAPFHQSNWNLLSENEVATSLTVWK